jgi:RNA polymerase sigma factor (sigma-70 family)
MTSDILKKQLTQLYIDESDSLYRFCFLRTSDSEAAIDILQDTFVSFWEVLLRGDEIRSQRAFLFTIARNRIIDWYRKKKSLSLDSLAQISGADGELFKDIGQKEDIEMAHEAKFLIEKIGEIVYFRYVENLTPKEIAEILKVSANVISVRIHRGLQQLRKVAGYHQN